MSWSCSVSLRHLSVFMRTAVKHAHADTHSHVCSVGKLPHTSFRPPSSSVLRQHMLGAASPSSGGDGTEAPARLPHLPVLWPEPTGQDWRMAPRSWEQAGLKVGMGWWGACGRRRGVRGHTPFWAIRGNRVGCVCKQGRHSVTLIIHYSQAVLQVTWCWHAERRVCWDVTGSESTWRTCAHGCVCVSHPRCLWCAVIAVGGCLVRETQLSQACLCRHQTSLFFLRGRSREKCFDMLKLAAQNLFLNLFDFQ